MPTDSQLVNARNWNNTSIPCIYSMSLSWIKSMFMSRPSESGSEINIRSNPGAVLRPAYLSLLLGFYSPWQIINIHKQICLRIIRIICKAQNLHGFGFQNFLLFAIKEISEYFCSFAQWQLSLPLKLKFHINHFIFRWFSSWNCSTKISKYCHGRIEFSLSKHRLNTLVIFFGHILSICLKRKKKSGMSSIPWATWYIYMRLGNRKENWVRYG